MVVKLICNNKYIKMKNTLQIIDFIKNHSGVKRESQVAKLLDMEPPALHNHKKRGTIPYKKLATYCENNGLRLGDVLGPAVGEGEAKEDSGITKSSFQEEELLQNELIAAQRKIIKLMEENASLKDELLKKPTPLSKTSEA